MIFLKNKRHSSILWKAFEISSNYFLLHRHFNVFELKWCKTCTEGGEPNAFLSRRNDYFTSGLFCKYGKTSFWSFFVVYFQERAFSSRFRFGAAVFLNQMYKINTKSKWLIGWKSTLLLVKWCTNNDARVVWVFMSQNGCRTMLS